VNVINADVTITLSRSFIITPQTFLYLSMAFIRHAGSIPSSAADDGIVSNTPQRKKASHYLPRFEDYFPFNGLVISSFENPQ